MVRITDQITPEVFMDLRRKVGWVEFPVEEGGSGQETLFEHAVGLEAGAVL